MHETSIGEYEDQNDASALMERTPSGSAVRGRCARRVGGALGGSRRCGRWCDDISARRAGLREIDSALGRRRCMQRKENARGAAGFIMREVLARSVGLDVSGRADAPGVRQ